MSVRIEGGRARSFLEMREEWGVFEEDLEGLSAQEIQAFVEIVNQGGEDALAKLRAPIYHRSMIGVEEFLDDEYYLGHIGKTLYPYWRETLVELFEGGDYHEAIFGGGIGTGKNTCAGIAMCYMLYQMSCIKDPQGMFGLEKNSDISFICLSVREDLARKVVFGSIKSKIMTSKYFMDCFPYKQTLRELRFPHNIQVAASASSMSSALSLNTFGGILDEVNFMPLTPPRIQAIRYGSRRRERTSHAETLYNMVVKRIKSRYLRHGKVPGILMLLSSKSHTDAFTEKRVAAGTNNPGVMVREASLWEVKRWAYSEEEFYVLAGNERIKSEILADEKMAEKMRRQIEVSPDHEGCVVLAVPEDFRHDFETDIDTALQDLAGIATVSISPFLQRPDALYECIDETRSHPMVLEWCPTDDPQIDWDSLVRKYDQRDASGVIIEQQWGPIVNPDIPRHVHIDTSLNKDATGVAIIHQYDWATRTKRHPGGDLYEEEAPVYYVDLMLRVVPPPGEDIIMADVRSLLYSFMDKGYHFAHLSTDQYQSVEMRQHFEEQRGVETSLQSVDKTMDPYLELRSAIYEGRILFYHYPPFLREISRVVHDKVKGKIEHIETESKDICDAVAGAVFTIMDLGDTQPIPMRLGIVEGGEADDPDEWLRESLPRTGKKAVKVLKPDPDDDFVMPTLG